MTQPVSPSPERVRDVAAKYRAWGYEVILDPTAGDLPEFLPGYRPDFIARLGDESVLVEIADSPTSDRLDGYRELAERVHAHPGWRLDLIVSNQRDRMPGAANYPLLPAEDIARRYREAEQLVAAGHTEAAFLIAWAATEAALRLLAAWNAVEAQRSATPALLKQLVSLGIISREQYESLWESYQQRSVVAHGFASREASDSASSVIALGKVILADLPRAA